MSAESRIVKPTPRPYQIEAKNNFLSGSGNMLLQLPTGTGKTLTAVIISEGTPGRVLFMAPTGALVYQTCQAYLRSGFWPNVEKADEYTGGPYIPDDREWRRLFPNGRPSVGEFVMNKVVVSTIQTFCDRVDKYREAPFDLIICDECVTGNTEIDTDVGRIRIDQVPVLGAKEVVTFDGKDVCRREITAFMRKGVKPTLNIVTQSGKEIQCTGNHLIYTNRGWVRADEIRTGDSVLAYANAGVEPRSATEETAGSCDIFPDTRITAANGLVTNGLRFTVNYWHQHLSAFVGAASKSLLNWGKLLTSSSSIMESENFRCSETDTTAVHQHGTSFSLQRRGRPFSAHFSVIVPSCTQTSQAPARDCLSTTGLHRESGPLISPVYSHASNLTRGRRSTVGTEAQLYQSSPSVPHAWQTCTALLCETGESVSPAIGWMASETSAWRGGLETMDQVTGLSPSTLKAFQKKTCISLPTGSRKSLAPCPFIDLRENTSCSASSVMPGSQSFHGLSNTRRILCGTNFERVTRIQKGSVAEVFDITVDGTHCFFGNGILVHNCHRSLAKSWLKTIERLKSFNPKARVLGATATPTRGDKQSMALLYPGRETPNGIEPQFCYRMPIHKGISDGYLVDIVCERGVLPGVDESIWKMGRKKSGEKDITDESLSRSMNNPVCIEGIAHEIFKYAGTRKGIVFLPGVDVTESVCATMNKMRPGCATFIHGKVKPKRDNRRRVRMIEDGVVQFVLGCDALIEGFDVPDISMVVMARFTGQRGRYEQMLGRGLRLIAKCIEGIDTPEGRREAIKASAKPDVLVLDFANSSRFKLVTVEDVLLDDTAGGGKKSKKLTEYVKKHRDPVDKRAMREQLEILDAMHAFEESLRQSGWVPPKYDFVYERVNLFGYGGTNQRQEMGRKTDAKRPTQEMVRQAEEMMIRNPESMTQGQLRAEIERRREKMVGRKNFGFLLNVCGLDKGKIDGAKLNWHDATYLRKLMMSSGRKSLPDNWEDLVAKNRAKRHHGGDE